MISNSHSISIVFFVRTYIRNDTINFSKKLNPFKVFPFRINKHTRVFKYVYACFCLSQFFFLFSLKLGENISLPLLYRWYPVHTRAARVIFSVVLRKNRVRHSRVVEYAAKIIFYENCLFVFSLLGFLASVFIVG